MIYKLVIPPKATRIGSKNDKVKYSEGLSHLQNTNKHGEKLPKIYSN